MHIVDEHKIFDFEYSEYGEDDQLAISIAINVARLLLQEPKITASQIVGIGHALYALQRLPVVTPEVNVRFGVVVHSKIEMPDPRKNGEIMTLSDMEYIDFCISGDEFEISRGGSKDCGIGHDSYSLPGWYVGLNGYRETKCELHWLEDSITMLLEREGTEISVEDNSGIDYFDAEETLPLNCHPLNQKAKELLQLSDNDLHEEQLYILQLIKFGLESPQMCEKRKEIRSKDLVQRLEEKVRSLRVDMTPDQVISFLLKDSNLSPVLETDDLIKGTTAALWLVIDQMILEYEQAKDGLENL